MIMRKKIVPLLIGKEVSPPRQGVSVFSHIHNRRKPVKFT